MQETASSTFVCPACKQRRGLMKDGQVQYETAPNGGRICHTCINNRDREQVQKGKITLAIVRVGDEWFAVNRTGKVRFKLRRQEGQPEAQVVGQPTFVDQEGRLWQGRLYAASGTAHFQRTKAAKAKGKAPAKAPRAQANGRTAKGKTPRAAGARAKMKSKSKARPRRALAKA